MFLLFFSLVVVGVVLFIAVTVFYSKKDLSHISSQWFDEPAEEDDSGAERVSVEQTETLERVVENQPIEEDQEVRGEDYVPILHIDETIPGLKGRPLVHFISRGSLYTIETQTTLDKIEFKQSELEPVVEGRLLLTSRYIVIYNEAVKKKFAISAIEKFHFRQSLLIFKRKNVKTKRDILKIHSNPMEFKYIFNALT